nr:reverse transcriptase domain-containing protein [Tanacetum cinerariifolium]
MDWNSVWIGIRARKIVEGKLENLTKYLSDFQFGVGVSGDAEAILHSVNRVLSEYHNDGSLAMLTVNFSNAFNLVDISALLHEVRVEYPSISLWVDFLYGQASRLYIGDTHIWSATRVQQGDPLRPLLFALILHPLLHKIKDSCKLLLHALYLDDGTVIGDSKEVARPSSSVKLLGGAISRDADFISGLAMRRAINTSEFLLLRSCMGIAKLFFGLRTCQPIYMEDAALFFDKEYRTILKYRLMIPLFPVDAICPVCRKASLDSFGEHVVHCKELLGFECRHDMVTDVLFDICRRAGISAKKEAHVNFLTDPSDGRSTLRPADILVFGWIKGKHACLDLTGVSPLIGLSSKSFTVGQAALKAASGKVTKHEKACIENQHVFIPFVFDTFGFLAPEAVGLLSRVQRVMHSNVMTPRFTHVVFKRIGFAIKKKASGAACYPLVFHHYVNPII